MRRAAFYAPYAMKHDWTPEQVDNLPADVAPYLLTVERLIEELAREAAGDGWS